MKVLFLNLPSPLGINVARDFLGFGVATPSKRSNYGHEGHVVPPIYEAYASAILEKLGFEVNVLDAQVRNLDVQKMLSEVERINPDVVISRISLPSYKEDLKLLSLVKNAIERTILVGWGGIVTVYPKKILKNSDLDVVIRGELEPVIADIITKLNDNKKLDNLEGVCFKRNNEIFLNNKQSLVKNLDELPLPAYHLLDMDKYLIKESRFHPEVSTGKKLSRFFSVLSSRGCSFKCVYCPYPVVFGDVWRSMSPKKTVGEIEHLVENYDVQGIWFRDQTFTMDIKRAMEICDEIIRRELDIRWTCETRVDRLTRELVRKMRKAGCTWISMGVETGDPQILKNIGKKRCTPKMIEDAFKITKEEGILRKAFVMVGLPGESWKSIEKTLKLLEKIQPDAITVDIVTPYPGTKLYEIAKKNKWLISEDWTQFTSINPLMSFENFSHKEMVMARRFLLDQKRVRKKIKRVIKALKEHKFSDLLKEFEASLIDFPTDVWRIYNLLKCKLKLVED